VKEEPGQEGFHIVAGELAAVDGVPICEDLDDDVPEGNIDGILTVDEEGQVREVPGLGAGLW